MNSGKRKNGKETVKRYVLFAISLLVISFGIAIITRSDLGTSPISSVPYVASLNSTLTLGTYFFFFTVFLILIQLLLLGRKGIRERKLELLMQFPVAFFLSVFTDLAMWTLAGFSPEPYFAKILFLIAGCAVLAFGICLEVMADVTMISAEYTIQFATLRFKKDFGTIKIIFDVSLVVLAVLLSVVMSGRIEGVREGTVITALVTGPFVHFMMPRLGFFRTLVAGSEEIRATDEEICPDHAHPVITVSREYGSGGHDVAKEMAKILGFAFYDKELITIAAKESGFSEEFVSENEQKLPGSVLYQMILQDYEAPIGKSLSYDDMLFVAQSRIIRHIAASGPCVIVGRCADYVLKDRPNTVNIFLYADMEHKKRRAVSEYGIETDRAEERIDETNRARAEHYFHYTGRTWGDARNYSAAFDTSLFSANTIAGLIRNGLAGNSSSGK